MTDRDDTRRLTDDELKAEFTALFPHGWAGPDVLAELAPDGWAASPLAAVYHPTAAQVYEESVRVHRNMASFPRRPDAPPAPPPPPDPTLDEVTAEHQDTPVDPVRECRELVGLCLWDVFSDNHDVLAADGRVLDLGSMRAGGGFLADVLNEQGGPPPVKREMPAEMMDSLFPKAPDGNPEMAAFVEQMKKEMFGDGGYAYLDFYMGTGTVAGRADLTPVYAMIFRRLHARGMDWKYSFPRLYLADMRPLLNTLKEAEGEPEYAGYDPSAAFEQEQADREHDEDAAKMRETLDAGHREAVEAARDAEPPATVRAYRAVYGEFPDGWPPVA